MDCRAWQLPIHSAASSRWSILQRLRVLRLDETTPYFEVKVDIREQKSDKEAERDECSGLQMFLTRRHLLYNSDPATFDDHFAL